MAATYPAYLQAVTITTGVNDTIVFDEGSGNLTATIAAGTYFLRDDSSVSDLAQQINIAMNAAGLLYTVDVEFNITTGVLIEIEIDSGTFKFNLASSTFPLADLLGFTSANESLLSLHSNADKARIAWVSNQPLAGKETSDQSDISQHITAQGQVHTYVGQDVLYSRLLEHELVNATKTKEATGGNASFEAWWRRAREGHQFEYHEQSLSGVSSLLGLSSSTLIDTLILGEDACRSFAPARLSRGLALYSWSIDCRRYVA